MFSTQSHTTHFGGGREISARSAKRSRPSSDFSTPPIKRTRIKGTFPSISIGEQNIVKKGPSIPHVPREDDPLAISQSNFDPVIQHGSFYLVTQPEQTQQPSPATYQNSTAQRYTQTPVSSIRNLAVQDSTTTNIMYDDTFSCLPGRTFGFPGQLSDCLPRFVPSARLLAYQPGLNDKQEDQFEDFDSRASTSEKPAIASVPVGGGFEPYSDVPSKQLPNSVAELEGVHFFACDNFPSFSPRQSGFLDLQPMPVETQQPFIGPQCMEYRTDPAYDVDDLWNDDAYLDGYSDRHHQMTHDHRLDSRNSIINNGSLWQSEATGRTATRRQTGQSQRRPFQSIEDRKETAQTRLNKACLRCRMQKIRCNADPSNPRGPCLTCQNVTSFKISNLECLRYKVTEIRLFKPGQVPGLDWTQRWVDTKLVDISEWRSSERRKILTTEGFSSVPLELEVREFEPQKGDVLERYWYIPGGIRKSVKVPCFAIANVETAKTAYKNYINKGGAEFIQGWLTKKNGLIYRTYSVALATANDPNTSSEEADLLTMVLQLWVAIRITTRSIRIRGDDTLGMPQDILDETSPLHGEIPVPPVMGAQIELILIQGIQIPLRKKVLEKLWNLIQANNPMTWFTRYLCIFILLHNCAMITKYDAGYAKKYIPERTYARPRMVEEYHNGANVLLAYWHYCNKGSRPFALGSSDADIYPSSKLDPYQVAFVKETSTYVQANEKSWKMLRQNHAYEQDFFFVSQLFETDWQPRDSVIR